MTRYDAHDHDPGHHEPLGVYWHERIKLDGAVQWRRHFWATARAPADGCKSRYWILTGTVIRT